MQPSRISLTAVSLIGPLLALGLAGAPAAAAEAAPDPVEQQVSVGPEPGGKEVQLDTTTFLPRGAGPHPAVLLTHGFGGSKDDVVDQARDLADAGLRRPHLLRPRLRRLRGLVHVADPDFEIADSRALIDVLAERDDVVMDADGDPRVGLVGASYGGAISLMTAATDDRVDTVAAAITWHDLADAFFPENVLAQDPGATRGAGGRSTPSTPPGRSSSCGPPASSSARRPAAAERDDDPVCGRFAPEVCQPFLEAADTGQPEPRAAGPPRRAQPGAAARGPHRPDLPDPGHGRLAVRRRAVRRHRPHPHRAGHAGGGALDGRRARRSSAAPPPPTRSPSRPGWRRTSTPTNPPVTSTCRCRPSSSPSRERRARTPPTSPAPTDYVDSATWKSVEIDSAPQPVLNPPGGQPSSITTVPNIGGSLDELSDALSTYALAALPGQSAAFDTPAFTTSQTLRRARPGSR